MHQSSSVNAFKTKSVWVVQSYFPGAVLANANILQKHFVLLLESSTEFAQCNFCSTSNHLCTLLSLKDIISTRRSHIHPQPRQTRIQSAKQ